ncbi:MAG: TolB family protein [Bacillota bacterium]
MKKKLLTVILILILLSTAACSSELKDVADKEKEKTAEKAKEGVQNSREENGVDLPAANLPKIDIDDSRNTENGGWLVDIPPNKENIYRVSSDNSLWVNFAFPEDMAQDELLSHLIVEPETTKIDTEYVSMGPEFWFRMRIYPTEPESIVKITLAKGVKNRTLNKELKEDITITLERFTTPWGKIYLKDYPQLPLKEYQIISLPPGKEVVLEFTKAVDKDSVEKAIAQGIPSEGLDFNWLNEKKVEFKVKDLSQERAMYSLNLDGALDEDGILVGFSMGVELIVVPDTKIYAYNLVTKEKQQVGTTSGGYSGHVSPSGSHGVFWELDCAVGDGVSYRYWLQNFTTGKKVYLTTGGGDPQVKWFGDNRVQVLNSVFTNEGEEVKEEAIKERIFGFDRALDNSTAYVYVENFEERELKLHLAYQWQGEKKVIKNISYPLYNKALAFININPSFDPSGERLVLVVNSSKEDFVPETSIFILNLASGEKQLVRRGGGSVHWSPRGDLLAVGELQGGIEIVTPNGEKKLTLPDYHYHYFKGWSGDGRDLIFTFNSNGEHETRIIEVETGLETSIKGMALGMDKNNMLYIKNYKD